MSTALKMNTTTAPNRVELAVIAVAIVAIGVLLAMIVSLLQGQVHKAAQRDAMMQSQRVAMARCWQDSPSPQAMRSCMSDAGQKSARAPGESYGTALREQPVSVQADLSTVSLRY